jgi:hypothetical protein
MAQGLFSNTIIPAEAKPLDRNMLRKQDGHRNFERAQVRQNSFSTS